jgi:hypothetical protein
MVRTQFPSNLWKSRHVYWDVSHHLKQFCVPKDMKIEYDKWYFGLTFMVLKITFTQSTSAVYCY